MGGMRADHPDGAERAAFNALAAALDHYRRGEADLKSAAEEAGLEEWDFLETAQALPDPVAPAKGLGPDLPTFIRERR